LKKLIPLVVLVLAVVAISGCVEDGGVTTTNGLEITDFSSDQDSVFSGRDVRISMTVENLGDYSVADAKAMAYLTGSNLDLTTASVSTAWDGGTTGTQCMTFGKELKAADPAKDTEPGFKTVRWSLTAPSLPSGQSRTDQFIGRVYYDYQTVLRGTVWAYPEAEVDAIRSQGETPETSTFTSTEGPLEFEVTIAPDPVVVYNGDRTFTMYIKITNTGGGTVFDPGAVTYNTGTCSDISISLEELNIIDFATGNVVITGATPVCDVNAELINGQATVVCDVTLTSDPATKQGYPVTITVDYGYYKDQELSITATGRTTGSDVQTIT
jgi:hypothetical protein